MTTVRAGTLTPATKPGPARVYSSCIELKGDVYHVMGFGSVQPPYKSMGVSRPCTGQGIIGESRNPIFSRYDDSNSGSHGLSGVSAIDSQTEQAIKFAATKDTELKLLPAPRVAGLLPARVIAAPPDAYWYLTPERQHEYYRSKRLNIVFKWTLEEIEVTYIDTHPERIALFKRFATPYDLTAEVAAERARVQDAVKHCIPRRFNSNMQIDQPKTPTKQKRRKSQREKMRG
jgi:hypothetical protein